MGIPGLYGWLMKEFEGVSRDLSDRRMKCDNLYLDMNGIIHPACHSDSGSERYSDTQKTEIERFTAIASEVNFMVKLCNPSNVVYLAIDGVAPRAKMNQQRMRRLVKAKEDIDAIEFEAQVRKERESLSLTNPTLSRGAWDSNQIAPGTEFMERLSDFLKGFIDNELEYNENWKDLTVMFSDSSVPGEGEHKMMDFIRSQQNEEDEKKQYKYGEYKHCLVGDDADFVLLGLAAKQSGVCVVRNNERRIIQATTMADAPRRRIYFNRAKIDKFAVLDIDAFVEQLRDRILRNVTAKVAESLDFDRVIHDIILFSSFVGNDFLPRLPLVDVRRKGLSTLLDVYCLTLSDLSECGYMVEENGKLNMENFHAFIKELACIEPSLSDEVWKSVSKAPNNLKSCPRILKDGKCNLDSCEYSHGDHVPSHKRRTLLRGIISKYALGELKSADDPTFHAIPNCTLRNGRLCFTDLGKEDKFIVKEFAGRNSLRYMVDKQEALSIIRFDAFIPNVYKAMVKEFSEDLNRRANSQIPMTPKEYLERLELPRNCKEDDARWDEFESK